MFVQMSLLSLQFGVCLWEIVTSQMPIRGEINVPSADDCPTGIISLIQDCMKNNPRDRPSAKEVYRLALLLTTEVIFKSNEVSKVFVLPVDCTNPS